MTALSEASGYFWVPILGMILLDEKMGKYKIIGGVVIFIGMILFALGG
jgi:drug/metabolite transporter (DMT)-like permease